MFDLVIHMGGPETKFKHSLEMYHKLLDTAKHSVLLFQCLETDEYSKCMYYEYDSDDFESNCTCKKILRPQNCSSDFESSEECWECEFYEPVKKSE